MTNKILVNKNRFQISRISDFKRHCETPSNQISSVIARHEAIKFQRFSTINQLMNNRF